MPQAAVGRHHLVLRADRLLQHVLLDVDALAGELRLGRHLAAQGVQGVQQADGERRAGAHAAAGRQVAVVVQLDAAVDAAGSCSASRTAGWLISSTVLHVSILR